MSPVRRLLGAVVSALGSSSAFAVTDRFGHFELRSLQPGPYVVRAHLAGYVAPRGQVVRVLPSTRSSSSIALRRVTVLASTSTPPIVPAALGPLPAPDTATPRADDAPSSGTSSSGDSSDVAWRLSHARRSILKDVDQAIPEPTRRRASTPTPRRMYSATRSSRLRRPRTLHRHPVLWAAEHPHDELVSTRRRICLPARAFRRGASRTCLVREPRATLD